MSMVIKMLLNKICYCLNYINPIYFDILESIKNDILWDMERNGFSLKFAIRKNIISDYKTKEASYDEYH